MKTETERWVVTFLSDKGLSAWCYVEEKSATEAAKMIINNGLGKKVWVNRITK